MDGDVKDLSLRILGEVLPARWATNPRDPAAEVLRWIVIWKPVALRDPAELG